MTSPAPAAEKQETHPPAAATAPAPTAEKEETRPPAARNEALRLDTQEAYQDYLTRFPNGVHIEASQQRLTDLAADEQAWNEVQRLDSEEAYQDYVARFPNGAHLKVVQQRLADLAADDAAWNEAQWLGTEEAYQDYLRRFPQGKHVDAARQRVADLENCQFSSSDTEAPVNVFFRSNQKLASEITAVLKKHNFKSKSVATSLSEVPWFPEKLPNEVAIATTNDRDVMACALKNLLLRELNLRLGSVSTHPYFNFDSVPPEESGGAKIVAQIYVF